MGNCISIDLSLADLITRCCECSAGQMNYVWQLKDNVEELKSLTNQLKATKSDLLRRLQNMEGPRMKQKEIVRDWLESVDKKLLEVDQLIKDADQDIDKRLCLGGCCSKNIKSSYNFGVAVADAKAEVDNLKQQGGDFKEVVEMVSVEPEHLHNLMKNLEALEAASKGLKGLKEDILRRVKREEGPVMKLKREVEAWFSNVDSLLKDVDVLIRDGPQEIEKWSVRDFSNERFGERVAERLQNVVALKQEGAFEAVVEKEPVKSEYISKLEDDLEALQGAREELWGLKVDIMQRMAIEEGQPKRRRTQKVGVWLSGVEATIADVDLLLKDGPQEIKKLSVGDFSNNYGEIIAKKLKKVLDLQAKGVFQEVTEDAPPEAVVEMDCGATVGSETKLKEIWSWIMKTEVGIVGLYGMGGVGKTTLLIQINNQFLNTPNDFDFVIWVVVSKDLKLAKVQEEIGERIGICSDEWNKKNISEKAKDISIVLQKKKFVLLLDDLWEKVHLAKAGVPIPNKQNGSKIVFTTRSEKVCSLMDAKKRIKVETLPDKEAWELFKEKVGEEVLGLHPAIPPIAKKVAKECGGLPLALITIARAMTFNRTPEAWDNALEQLQQSVSEYEGMRDEMFHVLKYSYDKLPDDIVKACFLYCALFPEDFKIYKDDLIDYWICEKFENGINSENVGWERANGIISTLVQACLLEQEGNYVKLHDVIRDMALWIACIVEKSYYNFFVKAGRQLHKAPEVGKWPDGVKRTSLMENFIRNVQELPTCPDLLTMLLCRNPRLQQINGTFFQPMRALTVLDLSNNKVQELPLEIAELNSLQYLNLSSSWLQQLPVELKKLKKLKYLNLECNDFLGMIPKEVLTSFSSLQVLRMFRCGFFHDGAEDNILSDSIVHIEALQLLKHLNSLSITIRTSNALQLYFSIENLPSCTQALSLECFSGSNSLDLSPLEYMDRLKILQVSATQDLEEIVVAPRILRDNRCFEHLREVTMEYCARVSNLSWLILAPNLTVLKVAVCEKIEEILTVAHSNVITFARLEVLVLEDLPQLKSICCEVLSSAVLKRVRVVDCPMLNKLPLKCDSPSKGNKKLVIEAEEHWWKNVEWEDEATKAAFQSSFRTCFPRTRICQPAHDYFYDIWKSMSS